MNLSALLDELHISHTQGGNQEFQNLGLLPMESGIPLCSFVEAEKFLPIAGKDIAVILTTKEVGEVLEQKNYPFGYCSVDHPKQTYFELHEYLIRTYPDLYLRKDFANQIDPSAQISPKAIIADHNVIIGKNCVVEENAMIFENTVLEDGAVIRAGALIGCVGFEICTRADGSHFQVTHTGGTRIGKDAQIQYQTTIDRSIYSWDDTVIGDNAMLATSITVSHGSKIGCRVLISHQAVLGGRVFIGEDSWVGLGAVLRNGIKVGKRTSVNMGAIVTRDVPDGASVTGNFAVPHEQFIRKFKDFYQE